MPFQSGLESGVYFLLKIKIIHLQNIFSNCGITEDEIIHFEDAKMPKPIKVEVTFG
jgi:hypothetical protein